MKISSENDYMDFRRILGERVRRTLPNAAGRWESYLDGNPTTLDELFARLCYAFLNGAPEERVEMLNWITDDEELWFAQEFIHRQTDILKTRGEAEALLLGLTAVALAGNRSDPRDVTVWTSDLYFAARQSNLPDADVLFLRVGEFASKKVRGGQWGAYSVSEQISKCPSVESKAWERRQLQKQNEVANTSGFTPLMLAALKGDLARLFLLIRTEEADVNTEVDGITALSCAVFGKQENAVKLLINCGARVDARPYGLTLLQLAEKASANEAIIELLKRAGAK